jgi:FAD/FMN-containing dehydrogenase
MGAQRATRDQPGRADGRPAIVADLSRHMNRIIEIDPDRRVARVQPGVVQEQLNLAAASYGLPSGRTRPPGTARRSAG